jgi:trigger factor
VKYVVTADDKLIDGQVERIQKQFGKAIKKRLLLDQIWNFYKRRKGINNATTISLDISKTKRLLINHCKKSR